MRRGAGGHRHSLESMKCQLPAKNHRCRRRRLARGFDPNRRDRHEPDPRPALETIWTRAGAVTTAEFDAVVLALPIHSTASAHTCLPGKTAASSAALLLVAIRQSGARWPCGADGVRRRHAPARGGPSRHRRPARPRAAEPARAARRDGRTRVHHHTFWLKAIPQYNLDHERFLEPLTRIEAKHPVPASPATSATAYRSQIASIPAPSRLGKPANSWPNCSGDL